MCCGVPTFVTDHRIGALRAASTVYGWRAVAPHGARLCDGGTDDKTMAKVYWPAMDRMSRREFAMKAAAAGRSCKAFTDFKKFIEEKYEEERSMRLVNVKGE